jgi:hypothetical protein
MQELGCVACVWLLALLWCVKLGRCGSSHGRAAYAWHIGAHAHRLAALRRERPALVVSPWWGVTANDNVRCAVAAVWCSAGVGPVLSTLNAFLGILSICALCQAAAPRACSESAAWLGGVRCVVPWVRPNHHRACSVLGATRAPPCRRCACLAAVCFGAQPHTSVCSSLHSIPRLAVAVDCCCRGAHL